MKTEKLRIYLEDEAPRIGCGWRTVAVKISHKWAYFTELSTGSRAKLKKDEAIKIIEESTK